MLSLERYAQNCLSCFGHSKCEWVKYPTYTHMKYEEYYAETDQITDKILRKREDIYLDLDTVFSN